MKKLLVALVLLTSCSTDVTYFVYNCGISNNDAKEAIIRSGMAIDNSSNNTVTALYRMGNNLYTLSCYNNDTILYYNVACHVNNYLIGYAKKPKDPTSLIGKLEKNFHRYCDKYRIIQLKETEEIESKLGYDKK